MEKNTTFNDLGIPFRLYEAPVETCSRFLGRGRCSLCLREDQWIFRAGIGDDLLVPCTNCGQIAAPDCDDKEDTTCARCANPVPWPLAHEEDQVRVCYDCLRAKRAWFTQDTALGMVRWEDAERGWTHGLPDDVNVPLASRPKDPGSDWNEFALAPEDAQELGRTPSYTTWQGERWPFHCGRIMIYLGEPMTHPRSEVDPAIVAVVETVIEREAWDVEGLDLWQSSLCAYIFRCPVCGALDGHADSD